MLEEARRGTERSSEKNEDDIKPIVRGWGMGFKAMFEAATEGNRIIERSFQTEADDTPVRRDGFLGQLEDAYRGTPERGEPRPIERGYGVGFRAMLDAAAKSQL